MRAALCRAHGSLDNVEPAEVPPPALAPGQVRVRVHAAAVNYPDVLLVADRYQVSVPAPFVPGSEFAGVVTEVDGADGSDGAGSDGTDRTDGAASRWSVGQRVFGSTMVGAFAEEVVVSPRSLTPAPATVGDREAAAFGVAHRTAYHVLRSVADLRPGEELVVLGAGGGVGSAAVQLGTVLGATVTAVASSPEKLEAARSCGARRLVRYHPGELRQALRAELPDGAHVVVDPVGGDLSEPALRSLRWGGRFVTVGYASGTIPSMPLNLVLLKGVHVLGFQFADFARHRPDELVRNERELLELFEHGRVAPLIGATFPLSEAAAALRQVAERRAVGKVVLDVAGGSG